MKAVIDLDLFDSEIENLKLAIEQLIDKRSSERILSTVVAIDNRLTLLSHELLVMESLRKKCEPIEEPKEPLVVLGEFEAYETTESRMIGKEPLPTTCVNEWENHIYCPLVGYCQKCENK